MQIIRILSRFFLGVLFVFSGFVKAVDPLGSAYKFADYFHAFNMDFLEGIALPMGIFLAAFELVIGLVIILGYQKKITYWVLLVFMSFFTLLTFILALTNPVTDCGCFGDAIILTNWQTFFKNIIFMVFVLILFYGRNAGKNVMSDFGEISIILLLFTGVIIFSVYCLKHLPVIDFRPYDVGTYIPEEMTIPEGMPVDEYETILFYENLETGETEEFTIENYPSDTTKYTFVTSESKLVKKGYEPPIHDFNILAPEGSDVTEQILDNKGYTLFMISYDLESADLSTLQTGNAWNDLDQLAADLQFIPVTSSGSKIKARLQNEFGLEYDFYSADEIMLKTVVRSNPGFVLIKHGTIMAKWSYSDFPDLQNWNPDWPEMIQQYKSEQDPELLKLIEEGLVDAVSFDMIDFDVVANKTVSTKQLMRNKKMSWIIMILSVSMLLVLLQFFHSGEKRSYRD